MKHWVFACLAVVACGNKKNEDDHKASEPSARPPAVQIVCDKLVAKALRDKDLVGYVMSDEPGLTHTEVRCNLENGPSWVKIDFSCSDDIAAAMAREKHENGVEEDVAVGKRGYKVPAGSPAGDYTLRFLDDDTNCVVAIYSRGNDIAKDPVPFAKDLAASLTPGSLK